MLIPLLFISSCVSAHILVVLLIDHLGSACLPRLARFWTLRLEMSFFSAVVTGSVPPRVRVLSMSIAFGSFGCEGLAVLAGSIVFALLGVVAYFETYSLLL